MSFKEKKLFQLTINVINLHTYLPQTKQLLPNLKKKHMAFNPYEQN